MGRVFSHTSRKTIVPSKNNHGYLFVRLGRKHKAYIHRLVYETFIGYTPENHITNHKNSQKDDNRLSNLEACDYRYNSLYAYENGERDLKPVDQYTLDGKFIKSYKNAKEAFLSTNVARSGICMCCKGKCFSAGGFIWTYKGNNPNKYEPYKKTTTPIVQCTLDGELLKIWDALQDAEVVTHKGNICRCCKGQYKSAGGFKWMYLSDYENLVNKSKNSTPQTDNENSD